MIVPEISKAFAAALVLVGSAYAADSRPTVRLQEEAGKLAITVAGRPVATYVYEDDKIPRPYFANVRAPGGIQVTRNHPPVEGKDRADHATMHPGIWMAFGDLGGFDFWRNQGRVVHEEFVKKPTTSKGQGQFVVRNRYVAAGNARRIVCREVARYAFLVRPQGYLLLWDSTLSADREFSFGDQEEMGLGVRVATPLAVEAGGTILDADGRRNGREVWGNAAAWCDYSGTIGGRRAGVALFCHPENFRPSWFHARDYGLLVANPFGRRAFGKGEPSKVVVKPGEALRLRYGIFLHTQSDQGHFDPNVACTDYLDVARNRPD